MGTLATDASSLPSTTEAVSDGDGRGKMTPSLSTMMGSSVDHAAICSRGILVRTALSELEVDGGGDEVETSTAGSGEVGSIEIDIVVAGMEWAREEASTRLDVETDGELVGTTRVGISPARLIAFKSYDTAQMEREKEGSCIPIALNLLLDCSSYLTTER